MAYELLDRISEPADVRKLTIDELPELARQIRERIVEVVGRSGGHLASNLGVTELTIALHYVFDFSRDRLLWDVGHQCYPHKLITGRHERFDTLRKKDGVSGFPSIREGIYDLFNVGHAGTAIPTATGMARADAMLGRDRRAVALVGDASIFNGLAFEGLNQAGLLDRQLLVVLNDNNWGISPTRGGMAAHLEQFRCSTIHDSVKDQVCAIRAKLADGEQLNEGIKASDSPHELFEQLGFTYVGPTDGHDLPHLIELLELLKDVDRPILLHVHTEKGRGADWACAEPGRFHSPKPFEVSDGKATIASGSGKSWTQAFADAVIERATRDDRIVTYTAGMLDGTGLSRVQEVVPERVIDVGIAESCAVDMAAGMAKAGMRPICAIYSTFLQRALDQIFQEVVLQGLPVILCMDRAGVVGGDGAVHHGFLDIAYLRGFRNMTVIAPSDEAELGAALDFALKLDGPCAIRYPRDSVPMPGHGAAPVFEMGRSRTMRGGRDATLLAYGSTVQAALDAAATLEGEGFSIEVVNARFAKPVDHDMVRRALEDDRPVWTVEDHVVDAGFGSAVLEAANELQLPTAQLVRLGLPTDRLIHHASRGEQLAEAGIDADGIAASLRRRLASERVSPARPRKVVA